MRSPWDIFVQIWGKMNFPGKKALRVFKYFNSPSSCQKLEKSNEQFLEKNAEQADGQTDRGW